MAPISKTNAKGNLKGTKGTKTNKGKGKVKGIKEIKGIAR